MMSNSDNKPESQKLSFYIVSSFYLKISAHRMIFIVKS